MRQTGRDFLGEAVRRLGSEREVTLVVDVLAPKLIAADPGKAAQDATGKLSSVFPSAQALAGSYGDLVISWISHIARTHRPHAVSLTELMIEDPRLTEAERVDAVTDFVSRAASAARAEGVKLTVDVRSNSQNPVAGRPDSGQDYARLLEVCDGLTLWAYLGLSSRDGHQGDINKLVKPLLGKWGDRVEISVGLWGDGSDILPRDQLASAVKGLRKARAKRVNVTPASLMTDAHWTALASTWS